MKVQLRIWYQDKKPTSKERAKAMMTKILNLVGEKALGKVPYRRIYRWEPKIGIVDFVAELRIIVLHDEHDPNVEGLVQSIHDSMAQIVFTDESFRCRVVKEIIDHLYGNKTN